MKIGFAALCLFLLSGSCSALSFAEAAVSGLQFTLSDLAPSDGNDPSFVLDPDSTRGEYSLFGGFGMPSIFVVEPAFMPTLTLSQGPISLEGTSDSLRVATSLAVAEDFTHGNGITWGTFTLSSSSAVTMSGLLSVAAGCEACEFAHAGSSILMQVDGFQVASWSVFAPGPGGEAATEMPFTFTYENSSGSAVDVRVALYSLVSVSTVSPAVPEPSSSVLLLAGLGLLSAAGVKRLRG